jgi:hypothetical protein
MKRYTMKFRSEITIRHDGQQLDPGIVDLPRELGERLGLEPLDGPTKEEREHDEAEKPRRSKKA